MLGGDGDELASVVRIGNITGNRGDARVPGKLIACGGKCVAVPSVDGQLPAIPGSASARTRPADAPVSTAFKFVMGPPLGLDQYQTSSPLEFKGLSGADFARMRINSEQMQASGRRFGCIRSLSWMISRAQRTRRGMDEPCRQNH